MGVALGCSRTLLRLSESLLPALRAEWRGGQGFLASGLAAVVERVKAVCVGLVAWLLLKEEKEAH